MQQEVASPRSKMQRENLAPLCMMHDAVKLQFKITSLIQNQIRKKNLDMNHGPRWVLLTKRRVRKSRAIVPLGETFINTTFNQIHLAG